MTTPHPFAYHVAEDPRQTGDDAERAIEAWLQARGLETVARNFRSRFGELDLVMNDAEVLAIIEVRYRGPGAYASAAETVTAHKQHRIIQATRYFLSRHPTLATRCIRFDVVAVDEGYAQEPRIAWHKAAFNAAG
ncbi:MAG: YraN family protein [Pseudomonadota bacterium]